ncbi:MlaD family protein [Cyclobacterium plantarum]|uniref:MlaD family protein n=1 Tax=Cyclobacterium plantarum TaxID=2716263 RepID=UPI003F70A794
MNNRKTENSKVGLMVLAGALFLVFTLYMVGRNQDIFRSNFTLQAVVSHVNGLVPGNNVRFMGMDVGTVKSIEMANDTSINITMVINTKMNPYIKKNAKISIGTDGLMGNKLVHINPQEGNAGMVSDGDIIFSDKALETDEMLSTLHATSLLIEKTSMNLYQISEKLNTSQVLWELLSDSTITSDIKTTLSAFQKASVEASEMLHSGKKMMHTFEQGNGLINMAFTDTLASRNLLTSIEHLQESSRDLEELLGGMKNWVNHIEKGKGSIGLLMEDSLLRQTLLNSAINLENGTGDFQQNMEALKSNFLFRRYFRKLEKDSIKNELRKN